jgi:hypothetical protein
MRFLVAMLFLISFPAAAQRVDAELHCKPTKTDFVYDCMIRLSRGREPLSGAQLSVGADMPSMPMAHNVRPVEATPAGKPGEYRAKLDLEMQGTWAVKLRLSGAVSDLVVVHYDFDDQGSKPTRAGHAKPSGHGH